jgi:sigma-B regulation protein RsbU (phosphoserine phosphatase)
MFLKFYLSPSVDAKRRLHLLNLGTSPAMVLIVIAQIRGKFVYEVVRDWPMAIALVSLALFPMTLAHVIVVQRAMDVRVVVRQGLQYALARNGIRVLQLIATGVVLIAGVTLAGRGSRIQSLVVIALGVLSIFTIAKLRTNCASGLIAGSFVRLTTQSRY